MCRNVRDLLDPAAGGLVLELELGASNVEHAAAMQAVAPGTTGPRRRQHVLSVVRYCFLCCRVGRVVWDVVYVSAPAGQPASTRNFLLLGSRDAARAEARVPISLSIWICRHERHDQANRRERHRKEPDQSSGSRLSRRGRSAGEIRGWRWRVRLQVPSGLRCEGALVEGFEDSSSRRSP